MFLRETMSFDHAGMKLLESESDDKNLYMKGLFIEGEVKNHNGRTYPVNEIKRAVGQINEQLKGGETVFGEADHPEELNINLDRVSHMITEMWADGSNGYGKLKVIPTPMGSIVKTLLEAGGKLGVSSRGSGNLDDNMVVSEFEMITADVVAKPSAPNAYPRAIYEALNYKRGTIIEDLANAVRDDPKAQKYLKTELLDWINALN